ncbi:MAG: hypothetical protein HOL31_15465 [Candidatus Scalindua sp.]|nr:hypothetical protein [Candidatus Scalindua sp.]
MLKNEPLRQEETYMGNGNSSSLESGILGGSLFGAGAGAIHGAGLTAKAAVASQVYHALAMGGFESTVVTETIVTAEGVTTPLASALEASNVASAAAAGTTVAAVGTGLVCGVTGAVAGKIASDIVEDMGGGKAAQVTAGVLAGAGSGAALGFAIGAFLPPPGLTAAAGAAIGGLAGAVGGFCSSFFD